MKKVTKTAQINEKSFIKNAIKGAKDFLKTKVTQIKKNATKIIKDFTRKYGNQKRKENFIPGKMIAMNYKAKDITKKYDSSPLVISLGPPKDPKLSKTHFIGLNLHWVPMNDRVTIASFFSELNKKRNGKLKYEDVKPFLYKFKGHPVLRMYIIKNIGPRVIEMPDDVFMTAAAIPSEIWAGGK